MLLYIDFDSTIHNPYDKVEGKQMGKPIYGAVDGMQKLAREGHKLVIFTVWATTPEKKAAIIDWLDYFGVPFHGITNIKGEADAYLDDKAITFTNWEDVLVKLDKVQVVW